MQTEIRLRLLRKSTEHTSGFEIVGYQKQAEFTGHTIEIFQARPDEKDEWYNLLDTMQEIEHDAFELGVKHGDCWWYDGDRVERMDVCGTVNQDSTGGLYISWDDGDMSGLNFPPTERIGTIHDETKAGEKE